MMTASGEPFTRAQFSRLDDYSLKRDASLRSHREVSDRFGYRALPQASVGNGNQCRSDLVSKVSPSFDRVRKVGIETDFVAAHLVTHQKDDNMPELAQGA
jgi:hypothetical protein